jgi:hypothetical protein
MANAAVIPSSFLSRNPAGSIVCSITASGLILFIHAFMVRSSMDWRPHLCYYNQKWRLEPLVARSRDFPCRIYCLTEDG